MLNDFFVEGLKIFSLLAAAITVILGGRLVQALSLRKVSGNLSNRWLIIFYSMSIGYSLFALGDLAWYLIFKLLKQAPGVSMPDFYWVLGSLLMLTAFVLLSFSFPGRHGNSWIAVLIGGGIVFIGTWLLLQTVISAQGMSSGTLFLSYYYPLVSVAITALSVGVYFSSLETRLSSPLAMFVAANVSVTVADILFTYTSFQQVYGLLGGLADVLYLVGYALIGTAFYQLTKNIRQQTFSSLEKN